MFPLGETVHLLLSRRHWWGFILRANFMAKRKNILNDEGNLFIVANKEAMFANSPLSVRVRPRTLDEVVGQEHVLGKETLLRRSIAADRLSSIILYGPPGCGKTTIALCVSAETKTHFEKINAVSSNIDELRQITQNAKMRFVTSQKKTILFIDEIHRFNKAQQDVLMPDLEEGYVVLIGATVFNPFFSLTAPLLSRSIVLELQPLTQDAVKKILFRAIEDKERGLGKYNLEIDEKAIGFLADICDGDARRALNALEIGVLTTKPDSQGKINFNLIVAQLSIQKKQVNYDRDGDNHYDTASAFIKSMRGSDPDAALYWMAKMIYAGEDPRFIARRICICAAEDVGNADPQALVLANSAMQVAEFIGLPEARIPLAQAAVYVACAPKSNAVYLGIDAAIDDIKNGRLQEVPIHLKDASYPGGKQLGRQKDYKYAHDYEGHYVEQDYMSIKKIYYNPTEIGKEKLIKERLEALRRKKA